jgi:hypothetical protein
MRTAVYCLTTRVAHTMHLAVSHRLADGPNQFRADWLSGGFSKSEYSLGCPWPAAPRRSSFWPLDGSEEVSLGAVDNFRLTPAYGFGNDLVMAAGMYLRISAGQPDIVASHRLQFVIGHTRPELVPATIGEHGVIVFLKGRLNCDQNGGTRQLGEMAGSRHDDG